MIEQMIECGELINSQALACVELSLELNSYIVRTLDCVDLAIENGLSLDSVEVNNMIDSLSSSIETD